MTTMRENNPPTLLELALALTTHEPLDSALAQLQEEAKKNHDMAGELADLVDMISALENKQQTPNHDCLSDETIIAYYEDSLTATERAAAETHFARCSSAVRRLAELHDTLRDLRRHEQPPKAAVVWRMLKEGLAFVSAPALDFQEVGLMAAPALLADGNALARNVRTWRQQAGPVELLLQLAQDTPDSCTLALIASGPLPPDQTLQVTMRREGAILQSEPLQQGQPIIFANLQGGDYEFTFASAHTQTMCLTLLPAEFT